MGALGGPGGDADVRGPAHLGRDVADPRELFIVYHLLHFTTGTAHPDFIEGDVYHNFVVGFQSVPVSLVYIFAMIALGLHLRHGVWSMFQTLGVSHPRYMGIAHALAWIVAIVVVVGNISFPVAVLAGIVK